MSYSIAAISNGGGAPEQAYRKMQSAGACPERPFAGTSNPPTMLLRLFLELIFGEARTNQATALPMAELIRLICLLVPSQLLRRRLPMKDDETLPVRWKLGAGLDELQVRPCTSLSYLFVSIGRRSQLINAAGSTDLWRRSYAT